MIKSMELELSTSPDIQLVLNKCLMCEYVSENIFVEAVGIGLIRMRMLEEVQIKLKTHQFIGGQDEYSRLVPTENSF